MKKIILLIFIFFSALIIYQIVLGKNGIIEGYKIKLEKERLIKLKKLLLDRDRDLDEYIKHLKKDPDSLSYFANKLGFYKGNTVLLKIIDDIAYNELSGDNYFSRRVSLEKLIAETKKSNEMENRLKNTQTGLQIFFYLFFGSFILLIIFGIQERKGND